MEFEVEKSIPIPEDTKNRYPLLELKVGESFVFPLQNRRSVQTVASKYKSKGIGEYVIRKINDTECRVWRRK